MELRSRTGLGTARRNLSRVLWPDITISAPPEGVVFDRDVPAPVRDGTVLRANVFRPATAGRYPVLLAVQPYGKDSLPVKTRSGYRVPLQYRLASN
ncbi:MAG: CocE/NonD family hydrolase, partial [Janthinobacterium lividum]